MDVTAPLPKGIATALPSDASQSRCFHGFRAAVEPKVHMFEFKRNIGSGACGQVFQAKCATDRKCDIAIKVIPLTGEMASHAVDEKKAILTLMNRPHPNIIEYFGVLEEKGKMHIIMELGQQNFEKYLTENISKLSISQFHEIVFQVLEILNHLDLTNVFHNDFDTSNMVLLNKKIKLIDFDAITDEESRRNIRPFSKLINAAYFLSKIQLKMKYKAEDKKYNELEGKFTKAITSTKSFGDTDAKVLSEDTDIWHDDLPIETRKTLSRCFIYNESLQREIIRDRHSITPRTELVF